MGTSDRHLDHAAAAAFLEQYAAAEGLDPRLDLQRIIRQELAATGRPTVSAHRLIQAVLVAWMHVDDVSAAAPCPPWCTRGAGHAYSSGEGDVLERHHVRRVASAGGSAVEITSRETVAHEHGPALASEAGVALLVTGHEAVDGLSADECEQLAAMLLSAAALLRAETT